MVFIGSQRIYLNKLLCQVEVDYGFPHGSIQINSVPIPVNLFERGVLGYIHIRKGPNKVGFVAIFQPFRDAIKLFSMEQYFPFVSDYLIYYFSPVLGFFFLCWFGC
jgi:NADH:ubiquinone oxidoreductase subunit H